MTRRVPPGGATPSCCQQHSEEVCESCVLKTTLTAENAVEANKLSNNYKVGGGTRGCSWRAVRGFNFFSLCSSPPQKTLSLQFGFKKWKSHVTARPWEDRSEIVKELYSDLNVIRGSAGGWPWGQPWGVAVWLGAAAGDSGAFPPAGSTLTCGNVLYLLLFGWWLSLLYVLVAALMFITVMGAPYGESGPNLGLSRGLDELRTAPEMLLGSPGSFLRGMSLQLKGTLMVVSPQGSSAGTWLGISSGPLAK